MRRDLLGEGERLDTVEGDDEYEEENEKGNDTGKIEVNLDDVEDDDDRESLLGLSGKQPGVGGNLFTIKES